MIKVERKNDKLIFRNESNGKFVKPILGDWSKLKEGHYSFYQFNLSYTMF